MTGIIGELDLEKLDMDTLCYLVITLVGIGISWGSLKSKVDHIAKHTESTEKTVSELHDAILLIQARCPKFPGTSEAPADCEKVQS